AGIAIAIGLIVWTILHFIIARVVEHARTGTPLFNRRVFRWAQPVLRSLDTDRRVQRAETIGSLLTSITTVTIVVVVALYVLVAFEINVGPLLTSVGILGVAIGFGCQQLIRDFLAGIFITMEDQYGIGDYIETSEVRGVVESVGLRITRVKGDDGAIWYLRNGEILRVGNRSQGGYVPAVVADSVQDEDGRNPAQKAAE
ncbi:MAG TPA: mechanosensitive ion channel domain-containing protein, partial [Micrococcaceae bacterium]